MAAVRSANCDSEEDNYCDEAGNGSGTEDELLPGNRHSALSWLAQGEQSPLASHLPVSSRGRRRAIAVSLGCVALMSCVLLASKGWDSATRPNPQANGPASLPISQSQGPLGASSGDSYPLRRLLESPDLVERASDQIMRTNPRLKPSTREQVEKTVSDVFRNVSAGLQLHVARVHVADDRYDSDAISLSKKQRDAVIHFVQYLADPRIVELGRTATRLLSNGVSEGLSRKEIMRKLAEELAPRMHDLVRLRSEALLLPPDASLDDLLSQSLPDSVRGTSRARLLQSNTFSPFVPSGSSYNGNGVTTTTLDGILLAEDVLGIAGAACEEARAILDSVRPMAKMFNKDLNIKPLVTSAVGACAFLLETATCELDAIHDNYNPIEMSTCPIQYGSAGMDMLRQLFTIVGYQGDNVPTNGQQGYHPNADANDDGPDDTFNPSINDFLNYDKYNNYFTGPTNQLPR